MGTTTNEKLVNLGQLEDAMAAVKDYVDENAGGGNCGTTVYCSSTKPANITKDDLWFKIL